uniref:Uncharacterized protein n=1 Tax=Arion vulgaris TaxID=1028688 RepID=A0A0B6ZC69_9EUPU
MFHKFVIFYPRISKCTQLYGASWPNGLKSWFPFERPGFNPQYSQEFFLSES